MKNTNNFKSWGNWFRHWEDRQIELPWDAANHLNPAEKQLVSGPLRQFQLGEGSEGRNWMRKTERFAYQNGQIDYLRALEGFIEEEHRHADLLERFMVREDISTRRSSGTAGLFKAIRHMVPLSYSTAFLAMAETIAIPFYQALGSATDSVLLKAICKQILMDEAKHLCFQGHALRMLFAQHNRLQRGLHQWVNSIGMELALDVVWFSCGDLLLAGGFDFPRFRRLALDHFTALTRFIRLNDENPGLPDSASYLLTPAQQHQDAAKSILHLLG